jgi:hypothetical protein
MQKIQRKDAENDDSFGWKTKFKQPARQAKEFFEKR